MPDDQDWSQWRGETTEAIRSLRSNIDDRLNGVHSKIDDKFDGVHSKLDSLSAVIEKHVQDDRRQFDEVNEQFGQVNERLREGDKKFLSVDRKLVKIFSIGGGVIIVLGWAVRILVDVWSK